MDILIIIYFYFIFYAVSPVATRKGVARCLMSSLVSSVYVQFFTPVDQTSSLVGVATVASASCSAEHVVPRLPPPLPLLFPVCQSECVCACVFVRVPSLSVSLLSPPSILPYYTADRPSPLLPRAPPLVSLLLGSPSCSVVSSPRSATKPPRDHG